MSLEGKLRENIAGEGEEWWSFDTRNDYLKYAKTLIDKGFSEDEAVEFLTSCYWTAAHDFGS